MIELSIYSIYSPDRVRAYELGKKNMDWVAVRVLETSI